MAEQDINPIDTVVYVDPSFTPTTIVISDNRDVENSYDQTLIDGIRIPIVQIGSGDKFFRLRDHQLKKLTISSIEILPELTLEVDDSNHILKNQGWVGLNNFVTIKILDPEKSAYRKITYDFQITSFDTYNNGNKIIIFGKLKYLPLEINHIEQIKDENGNKDVNTFNFLKQCSRLCGLGFAASPGCEDIDDSLPRNIASNLKNAIDDAINEGGLDEESIFQWWLDPYGYITMVNLPYIFNCDILPEQLKINAITGLIGTDDDYTEVSYTTRTITNYTQMGFHNLLFKTENVSIEEDMDYIKKGTQITYYIWNNLGVGGDSVNLSTKDVQITNTNASQDSSMEDDTNTYAFQEIVDLGAEFSPNGRHILWQREIRKRYLPKLYSKKLKVRMETCNFGLQRGNLVNLAMFFDDKSEALRAVYLDDSLSDEEKNALTDSIIQVENPYILQPKLSGIYFICGVEFVYSDEDERIHQNLFLIKKDNFKKMVNW